MADSSNRGEGADYSASGDDKAMSPCDWQSESTSAPLNHTMTPEDDFLIVGHPSQLLSVALSKRSGRTLVLAKRQFYASGAVEMLHHSLGGHVVDLPGPCSRRQSSFTAHRASGLALRIHCALPTMARYTRTRVASTGFSSASVGCLVRIPGVARVLACSTPIIEAILSMYPGGLVSK